MGRDRTRLERLEQLPTASTSSLTVTQTGHSLTAGMPVTRSAGTWVQSNAATPLAADALVSAVTDANTFTALFSGPVTLTTAQWDARTGDVGGLTDGHYYFLGGAGLLTKTQPTTGNEQVILKATSTTDAVVEIGDMFALGTAGSPLTTKGDLYGRSTVDARIPIGQDGRVLVADSAQTLGVAYSPAATDYRYGYFDQDTFLYGVNIAGNKTQIVTTGASYTSGYSTAYGALRPGVWKFGVTSATDGGFLWGAGVGNAAPNFQLGNGTTEIVWWIRTDGVLSNATNRYFIVAGLSDSAVSPSAIPNGIYAQYEHDINGGAFQLICNSGSVVQTAVNGITLLAINTWYRVRIVIDMVQKTATLFLCSEGGIETLECVYSGTFPVAGQGMAPHLHFRKNITDGVTERFLSVDGWQFSANYATQI